MWSRCNVSVWLRGMGSTVSKWHTWSFLSPPKGCFCPIAAAYLTRSPYTIETYADKLISVACLNKCLNTHQSESLVRFVAQTEGLAINLGVKGESGILTFVANTSRFFVLPQSQNCVSLHPQALFKRSIKLRFGSVFWCVSYSDVPISSAKLNWKLAFLTSSITSIALWLNPSNGLIRAKLWSNDKE